MSIMDYKEYYDVTTAIKQFNDDIYELTNNPDYSLLGSYDTIQEANDELQYQRLTMKEITIMNMARYGNVIESLQAPDTDTYWVFIGAK